MLTALSREAYGPAFAGIFFAYLIALIIQRRKIPWREGVLVALSCIGAGLYGAYLIYVFRASPGLAAWSAQNAFTSPDLFDFLAGFAVLIVLAAAGLFLYFKHPQPDRSISPAHHLSFLMAWLIAGPIMAYLPIAISRRLIVGWQIPLCLFGAYALLRLIDSKLPLRRTLAVGVLAASALSTLLVITGGTMFVTARQPPLFQTADQLAALDWLGRRLDRSGRGVGRLALRQPRADLRQRTRVRRPPDRNDRLQRKNGAGRSLLQSNCNGGRSAGIDRSGKDHPDRRPPDRLQLPDRAPLFQQGNLAIYRVAP